jgi:hypothetical protein
MSDATTTKASSFLGVRLPVALEQELENIARRDCNSVSATTRRLLSLAIRMERRAVDCVEG